MSDEMIVSGDVGDAGDVDEHAEPVVVATHTDRGEAEVTVAHLAANGVQGFVVDEISGGTVPVDGEAGVAVAVRAIDAGVARSVLGTASP